MLLQIPFSYVMGYIIDFYNEILDFQINFLPLKFLVLAAAILCTALAAYVVVTMDLVPNPSDGVVRALSYAGHLELGKAKFCFDCTMVAVTAIISLAVGHRMIGIGIGTVLSALFIGRMIQVFSRRMDSCLKEIVEESKGVYNFIV